MRLADVATGLRVTLAAGTVIAALGANASPAAATGNAWDGPAAVIPEVSGGTPQLVVDARGAGYVADSGLGTPLRGVAIAADGTPAAPRMLASAVEHPRDDWLGISSSGTVTAAYGAGSGRNARVMVRHAIPRALPRQISPQNTTSTLVSFQEAPDGFAVALLCLGDQRHCAYAIYARQRDGTRFRRDAALPAGAQMPALAVTGYGALVVWVGDRPDSRPIRALEVRRNATVTTPITVARHPHISRSFPLELAVLPHGAALVAWRIRQPGDRLSVSVATRAPGASRFGSARALTTGRDGHDTIELRVITSRDSALLCTSEAPRRGTYRVVVRTWTPVSGISAARFASPALSDAFDPVAVTGAGRTIVAWDGAHGIQASIATGDSPFGAPDTLSTPTAHGTSGPDLAVDARGAPPRSAIHR